MKKQKLTLFLQVGAHNEKSSLRIRDGQGIVIATLPANRATVKVLTEAGVPVEAL